MTVRQKALQYMLNSGISPRMRGFPYLTLALEKCYENREYLTMLTKILYPEIAKHYGTTQAAVERVMRYALHHSADNPCSVGEFLARGIYLMELY